MNYAQRVTKLGKPITNILGLPLFNKTVDIRIKTIRKELGFNNNLDKDERWNNIINHTKILIK